MTTRTVGTDLDSDGYVLSLGTMTVAARINDAVTFQNAPIGSRRVELGGLAPNCTADGNEAEVEVDSAATSDVAFDVTCNATTGSLRIVITTTGFDLDPDGYARPAWSGARMGGSSLPRHRSRLLPEDRWGGPGTWSPLQ